MNFKSVCDYIKSLSTCVHVNTTKYLPCNKLVDTRGTDAQYNRCVHKIVHKIFGRFEEKYYLCIRNQIIHNMTQLTVRDFRSQMATSLDRVDAGEHVFIRRKNQLYAIVPVEDDDLTVTPELAAKIEKARQEYREGKAVSLKTHEDIDSYFESM